MVLKNIFPSPTVVTYHHEVVSFHFCEVSLKSCSVSAKGKPTDELHPFTKNSETGMSLTIDSTALSRGKRQISICVYYLKQNGQSAFAGFHQFQRATWMQL